MLSLTAGPALFVQPHYDDVPLSCGGTVTLLANSGHEPHMVTKFATELLPQMVGEFAAWKHERWKLTNPNQVLEARRAEVAVRHRERRPARQSGPDPEVKLTWSMGEHDARSAATIGYRRLWGLD